MKKAIVATKVGMTQIFNEDGVLTPVTVLEADPGPGKSKRYETESVCGIFHG